MNIIKRLLTKLENKKRALNEKNKPVSTSISSKRGLEWSRAEDIYSDANQNMMRNYMLFGALSEQDKDVKSITDHIESPIRSNEGCSSDDDSRRHSYHHSDVGNCSYSSDDSSSSSSSSDCSSSSDSSSCSND